MSFGKRLKQARNNKKMLQTEVAKKLGIDDTTISKYENDKSEPDNETIKQLALLYDVSVDWLMGGNKKESDYTLPEEVILKVLRAAEEEFKVSLSDDPLVESAVRDLLHNLAKMKKGYQKTDQ